MALIPTRTKFRKQQRGHYSGDTKGCAFVEFGEYGMQALERGWITSQQIEACRVAITRCFTRRGKVWIRIFPDKPISKKPAETRMGTGKGAVEYWVAVVRPGRVLFEVSNVTKEEARNALRLASAKLGVRTKFVSRVEEV
ncbi:MAG: 50S ribosomal protein L16 [Chlamydiae bacterium]|nr:50S ribosomal protein L16 [Chlamydiota bacterium]